MMQKDHSIFFRENDRRLFSHFFFDGHILDGLDDLWTSKVSITFEKDHVTWGGRPIFVGCLAGRERKTLVEENEAKSHLRFFQEKWDVLLHAAFGQQI